MPVEKITHEKIINAVLKSAFVNSVGATSLADIAGLLGIKKASLYNHYESREAMVLDTMRYCGDYIKNLSFISDDLDILAKKYAASSVLKNLAHKWIHAHEDEQLLQVYSFVESEKYFSSSASEIIFESRQKLIDELCRVFNTLFESKKIKKMNESSKKNRAELFVSILCDFVDKKIVEKKKNIRQNPETGAGELFTEVSDSKEDFSKIDTAIESFTQLLN